MEATFQEAIAAGKINGVVMCATDGADFTYNKAIGERTLLSGERRAQQLDDIVYLASASKLLATIAALQCVQDGLLTLKGSVSEVAPELAAKQVLKGFADDGSPILEPAARPITLEMLLTHSSGEAYDFLEPAIAKWKATQPKREGTKTVEELYTYPLIHQPGGGWMYGPASDWAGRIVERVTGRTLGEHIAERILAPLGISEGQFFPVTREDMREHLVDLNPDDLNAYGVAVVGPNPPNALTKGDFGGHGYFMATIDYVKILQSLLLNDGRLLKPETVDSMFEDHLAPEATPGHQAALQSPAGIFYRCGVDAETKMAYGLGGVLTLEDSEGWYGAKTLTWGGGLTLTWFIDRTNKLCAVAAFLGTVPMNREAMGELKQVFRKGIYQERRRQNASK